MTKKIFVTKAEGDKEPFSVPKLRKSMFDSGASKKVIDSVIKKIQSHVRPGVSTSQIHRLAFQSLKSANKTYAARYNLKKAIMRLGPDGFPFERYLAALLERQGYEVFTNVVVQGKCITHEVDVIAEDTKRNVHAIIEAKFHSRPGRKTGSKDALYTYGRFLDIKEGWKIKERKGAKPRGAKLESWLVTNTEMTYNAINYCNCVGIKPIAWSYPHSDKNIQGMIHNQCLYPITTLLTLNNSQKRILLDKNIILCSDLLKRREVLRKMGLKKGQVDQVILEVSNLCSVE